ncbi:hypothetical protein [Dongia sp.]|uniref:hypothetical protein n=1 Tax=Dongia sp. TaxID=1977262 RepID=UPI0035AFB516
MVDPHLLLPGEKLLWQGQPAPGLRFEAKDALLSLFGCFFFGFSLFWEYQAYNMGAPVSFQIFGLPFIAVGAYLVILRYFWEAYERGKTTYVLTDKRAIISIDGLRRRQNTVTLASVDELTFEEKSSDLGTIVFGRDVKTGSGKSQRTSYAPRFKFIPAAKRVYQLADGARIKSIEA